jgi:membrane-bound serine protease (ClpP class)
MLRGRSGRVALLLWLGLAGLSLRAGSTRAGSEPVGKNIVVEVGGTIDLGLSAFIQRVLRDAGPGDLVVLHINTFGGRVDAAVAIRDALLGSKAKTLSFIDKRAISAGALIALATDTIVMTTGATIGAATPVELKGGEMAPVESKVVSYFRKEMKATAEAKGRRGDIAEAMVDPLVVIDGLDGKDTTLTLTTTEAIKYKIAAYQAETLDAVMARARPAGSRSTISPGINWAERVASFLSQPAIASLLMSLGMLGIVVEFWSGGHGVAATFGVICLLLYFFGQYVIHLAGWGEVTLFAAGVVAVGIEVFFTPTHGALAVLGVLAIIVSLVLAMLSFKHVPFEISWSLGWVTRSLMVVFGSILATTVLTVILARFLPRSRLGKALVLERAITETAGAAEAQAGAVQAQQLLVGATGQAETSLRPAGKASVGGRRLDVVTDGDFVEAGTPIVVVSVADGRIVVRSKSS